MKYKTIPEKVLAEFIWLTENIDIRPTKKGCWNWPHMKDKQGYGYINEYIDHTRSKHYFVHRISYTVSKPDIDISDKLVRHTCDNPSCWNPDHLLDGTQKDNMNDMITRLRRKVGKNMSHVRMKELKTGSTIARRKCFK